jgi:transposase
MKMLSERLYGGQIPMFKPTVAMDRGMATEDNVKWLRENGYHYIVIKREDNCEEYRGLFESERGAFSLVSSKKSVYGEENNVYVRLGPACSGLNRALCISEGKARKEQEIYGKKDNPFLEDIDKFRGSIRRGTIKKPAAIEKKLERIMEKHKKISAWYDAALENTEGVITGISLIKKGLTAPAPLFGCYVIETTHTDLDANDIWKLYMTLSRVEGAFRSMKETLGMRPVYHQTADRSAAHLFITVLAYHLLATIENLMERQGDTRTWGTLREVMSTLMRGTVAMRDDQGASYYIRVSGEPEDGHQDILSKMDVGPLPKTVISKINTL